MSNHDAISDSYEDLFDDDIGKDHPCYLPDKTQDYEPLSSQDYKLPVAIKKTSNRHSAGEIDCEENEGTSCSNGAFIPEEGLVESASAEDTVVRKFSSRNGEASAGNGFSQGSKEGDHIQESEISSSPSSCGGGLSSSGGGTSGYVVGSGSSSAASLCSVRGVEEIRDFVQREDRDIDDTDINKVGWTPGKQHADEDDTYSSWRKRKKHFFILSHAGKPIYSRYGDEHKLAGFSATLQAIMSFVENSGDRIRLVRAGDHQIVFMVKGPIYLVSICATEEPAQSLRRQLELLHGQLLLILTKSVEKCFVKNAKFDMKPLLGGTEMVFSSLIHAFSWNFATFLHSYTCLPLPYTTRQATGAALQDVADTDVLFALLLCGSKVISLVGSQKASLHPDDILLLANFVSSSESFRTTESFSPVCLPRYNANVFLYAYVQYLNTDICLIFLTTSADGFFHLKECRSRVEGVLTESRVLLDIGHSVLKGGLRVEDLPGDSVSDVYHRSNNSHGVSISAEGSRRKVVGVGGAAGLWHFIYRNINLDQYVASEYSPCLHTRYAQKRLFRAYQRLFTSMHNGVVGTHKMQYQRDEDHVLLSWCTQDFELFAAFDPLAEKSSAITVCNRICQWLRDLESEIFLIGASPFSW